MRLVWIGTYTNELMLKKITDRGFKPMSSYVSQCGLIRGFKKKTVVDTISGCRIPFENGKICKINGENWIEKDGSVHRFVDTINIPYLELIYKIIKMKKAGKAWAKKQNEKCDVLVYELHLPNLICAKKIKKIHKKTEITCIIPDLPQFMDLNMSPFKRFLKKIDWLLIKSSIQKVDKFVLYSKHMAKFLDIPDEKWMLMEGMYDESDIVTEEPKHLENVIMYSGACNKRYGMPLLLEAFTKLENPNYRLWVSGSGDAVDIIKAYEQKDKRIEYLGYLPSRKDLLIKQKQATLMINMRLPNEQASAYCFPSKIMEYMLTGNPVLTFDIKGIPDEYFKYLIVIDKPTVECIADTIESAFNLPYQQRKKIGELGKEYIMENKSNNIQAEKILNFIGV